MDYLQKLQYHYKPRKGWINDPNGLIYYDGYYHIFYQHDPESETPGGALSWGHARTKDFLQWEELPVAIRPDKEYDSAGCWSGTAAVKDGMLYLVYSSTTFKEGVEGRIQTVSVAYSKDGINFKKYEKNPVIKKYPNDGGPDFRDPAVCRIGDNYYCVMATGNPAKNVGRLLLYKSSNVIDWEYVGIMSEWDNCNFTECPSFTSAGEYYLLTTSVCPKNDRHFFTASFGKFEKGKFTAEVSANIDDGPDQYAGQVFKDSKNRNVLISWIPGWEYAGYAAKDVGCMSVPRELKLIDGKIICYPIEEFRKFLTDNDPSVKRTEKGFVIEREGRSPVVYEGVINDLKILRDGYVVEVFVNGGERNFTVLL